MPAHTTRPRSQAPHVHGDRRTDLWYAFAVPRRAYLSAEPSRREYPAVLRDVSRRGVGLLTCAWFGVDTELSIRLMDLPRGVRNTLPARVRHATALPDGTWLIGCRLTRPFTALELRTLAGAGRPPR